MSRRIARDSVYKLVFEYLFSGERGGVSYEAVSADPQITETDKHYIDEVYNGVIDRYDELVSMIAAGTTNFNSERIYKPDLAALLVATYEIKYMDDIPPSVSISEILDLVKTYSTEKSGAFVNGVLAGVYKNIKE